jgi:hypothetical protein
VASFAALLKKPIQVQGRDVVIVPDMVGPVPISEQHQYVESAPATNTCPTIHIREADIEEMRERHPGVPVYGLWHVLIHSGLVSFKRMLQVVPVGDDDGFYIHCDLGRAEYSGIYESGFFAADASFTLDEALILNPAIDQLVMPAKPAKLAVELRQERQIQQRQAWSTMALAVVVIVSLGFGTNIGLGQYYQLEQSRLDKKNQQLMSVRSGLDQLRTTRLTEVPNDSVAIERIAALWALDPNLQSKGDQSFQNPTMEFTLGNLQDDPKDKLPWLQSRYDPRGNWLVTMNVKG